MSQRRAFLAVVVTTLALVLAATPLRLVEAQRSSGGKSADWPLHNLDLFVI